MEYEHDEDNESQGLVARLRESPRTVSALIIILIVVAAMYAFSGDNDTPSPDELSLSTTTINEEADNEDSNENNDATTEASTEASEDGDVNGNGATTSTEATPEPTPEPAPEAERTAEGYKEFAQAGDGVTHIARRGVDQYLNENTVDFDVSAEHKVYMEDYIKDHIGSRSLSLHEEVTVTFEMIESALDSARNLNEQQLQNLQQYTAHVG